MVHVYRSVHPVPLMTYPSLHVKQWSFTVRSGTAWHVLHPAPDAGALHEKSGTSQFVPPQPAAAATPQLHAYCPIGTAEPASVESWHVPPFWHGP